MTEAPRTQGGEDTTDAPAKPSIAEVAAWLRRAAEQRDSMEDLRPAPRPAPPPTSPATAGGGGRQGGGHDAPGDGAADRQAAPDPSSEIAGGDDGGGAIEVHEAPAESLVDDAPVVGTEDRATDEERPTPEEPAAADAPHDAEAPGEEAPGHVAEPGLQGTPTTDQVAGAGSPSSSPEVPVLEDVRDDGEPADEVDQDSAGTGPANDEEGSADEGAEASAVASLVDDEGLAVDVASAPVGPAEPRSDAAASVEGPSPGEAEPQDAPLDRAELGDDPPADGLESPGDRTAVAVDRAEPASGPDETLGEPEAGAGGEAGPTDDGGRSGSTTDDATEPAATGPIVAEDAPKASVDEARTEVPEVPAPTGGDVEVVPDAAADASAARARAPEPTEGLQALSAGSSSVASLFDLDLAELAARARASAEARMASITPPASTHDAAPAVDRQTHFTPDADADSGGPTRSPARTGTSIDLAVEDDLDVRDGVSVVPSLPAVGRDAPFDHTRSPEVHDDDDAVVDLRRADVDERRVVGGDVDERSLVGGDVDLDDDTFSGADATDGQAAHRHPAEATTASSFPAMATRLQARRAKRKRYPRGQLKEKIGILRRIRAMLGVVVLTVVLGVAAGAAIGAFLIFLAFAIRGAITSG